MKTLPHSAQCYERPTMLSGQMSWRRRLNDLREKGKVREGEQH